MQRQIGIIIIRSGLFGDLEWKPPLALRSDHPCPKLGVAFRPIPIPPITTSACAVRFARTSPQNVRIYVNTSEVPYDRHAGDAPALDGADIDDVIAFLNTQTDGFEP